MVYRRYNIANIIYIMSMYNCILRARVIGDKEPVFEKRESFQKRS